MSKGIIGGNASAGARSGLTALGGVVMGLDIHNFYRLVCRDAFGNINWEETIENLVTTEGKNDLLTNYFKGSAYTAAFYVGLVSGASPTFAAGDTDASHAAWTEFTGYSQATRPALVLGTASAGSIDNSASQAVFSINASGTIGGAFVDTSSAKSSTTGKLYGEAALGTARTVASGDTLNITCTLTV